MVGEGGTGIGRGREVGWMLGERRSACPFSRVPGEGRAVGFRFPGKAVQPVFASRVPGQGRAVCFRFPGKAVQSVFVSRAKPHGRLSSPGSRTKKERVVAFRFPFPGQRLRSRFRLPDAGPRPCSRFSFPGSRVKPCGRFSRMRSAGGRLFRFRAGRACRGETIRLRMAVRLGVRGRICSRPP